MTENKLHEKPNKVVLPPIETKNDKSVPREMQVGL